MQISFADIVGLFPDNRRLAEVLDVTPRHASQISFRVLRRKQGIDIRHMDSLIENGGDELKLANITERDIIKMYAARKRKNR